VIYISKKKTYKSPEYKKNNGVLKSNKKVKSSKNTGLLSKIKVLFSKISHVGEVHRGNTKFIDTEPKLQRNYVVVKDKDGVVSVSKLKSIKKFDDNGKNNDPYLIEINQERYGLEKRTGVDKAVFRKNRMSNKPLDINDKKVFPEGKPRFSLSSKDRDRSLYHTGIKKRNKKRRS